MKSGKLYLIPTFLGEDNPAMISEEVKTVVSELDEFIVENARTARRYLRAIGFKKNFDTEVVIHELQKHEHNVLADLMSRVLTGKNCGVISEAGNPCIADPGNQLVAFAHRNNIQVV